MGDGHTIYVYFMGKGEVEILQKNTLGDMLHVLF